MRPRPGAPGRADRGATRLRALLLGALALGSAAALAAVAGPWVLDRLGDGEPAWLVLAAASEAASCAGFVALFGAVFRRGEGLSPSLRRRIASAELGAGMLLPSGGLGGAALGAWALRRAGLPSARVASGSVAFLVLQNGGFVVATAVLSAAALVGLLDAPVAMALPALAVSLGLTVAALLAARGGRRPGRPGAGRLRIGLAAIGAGASDALGLLRSPRAVLGAIAFAGADFGALWAAFRAFGEHPSPTTLLLGYLLGQGGSAVPTPCGIGAVEGGMIGALAALGLGGTTAAAGVLAYRAVALVVSGAWGGAGYLALRRALPAGPRCAPARRAGPAVSPRAPSPRTPDISRAWPPGPRGAPPGARTAPAAAARARP
jgi:uncharacterized membrane protein YbhN (UPF0104 family)